MANDHFISRFLTKRWEVQPGKMLHVFDFATSTFDLKPSARLFADEGLHSVETGAALNTLIEQPVAQHLRALETNPRASLPDPKSWPLFRALASLWWLQALRISDAKTPGELAFTLDQLLVNGEAVVDAIGVLARDRFHLFVANTRERLFFTEVSAFPIPLPGGVLLALPLSPHHFLTLAPRDLPAAETNLQAVMNASAMLSALSIGVGSGVRTIVLPPEMAPTNQGDELRIREGLLTLRDCARRLADTIGEASALVGLPSWRVT